MTVANKGKRDTIGSFPDFVANDASRASWRGPSRARQTSIVTSRPAWRNYKTGPAAVPGAPACGAAARRSEERAAARPRRATGVHVPWVASRRCCGATRRGRGDSSTRRAALRSAGAGALSAAASARRRRTRPRPSPPAPRSRTHQNDEFIFRACWPSYPRTLPRVAQRPSPPLRATSPIRRTALQ
ncbi:unnamed protein product, partial [Iphiclides podalirius]